MSRGRKRVSPDRAKQAAQRLAGQRARLLGDLSSIGNDLDDLDQERADLLASRDRIVKELRSAGVTVSELARLARVSRAALLKRLED